MYIYIRVTYIPRFITYVLIFLLHQQDWEMTSKFFSKDSLLFSRLAIPQPKRGGGADGRVEAVVDAAAVEELLREKLGELLGVSPGALDLTQPMTNYGVDSLVSVELVNWANRSLGIVVSQLDVLGGITAEAILQKALGATPS